MKSRRPMFTVVAARMARVVLFLVFASPLLRAADMKPEDVVARHLDSIGTAEARAAAKTRIVQGSALFKILVGGGGELQGTSALVSEGRKSVLMVKFNNGDYRGEQFVTDGEKVSEAATTANHKWSDFGVFVRSQDQIVREGLLGGELTTAWALLNLAENKAKLTFDGEKKVDGRPAYQLTYHSKKRDELTVHLYFDPQTFQHIMTTYAITLASGLAAFSPSISDQAGLTNTSGAGGADVTQSSKQKETRYTIEERFSDFKTNERLTLPKKYSIHFTEELQNGTTKVFEWDLTTEEISNNHPLDARNFQVK
ncbi:MAG: hypothetical protein ACRD20_00890 [Terriglobales bacterium]